MRKGNSPNSKNGWYRGVSVPGAFKLDHLQPVEPILYLKFSNFCTWGWAKIFWPSHVWSTFLQGGRARSGEFPPPTCHDAASESSVAKCAPNRIIHRWERRRRVGRFEFFSPRTIEHATLSSSNRIGRRRGPRRRLPRRREITWRRFAFAPYLQGFLIREIVRKALKPNISNSQWHRWDIHSLTH